MYIEQKLGELIQATQAQKALYVNYYRKVPKFDLLGPPIDRQSGHIDDVTRYYPQYTQLAHIERFLTDYGYKQSFDRIFVYPDRSRESVTTEERVEYYAS